MVPLLYSVPLMVSVNPFGIVIPLLTVNSVTTVQVVASVQVPFKSEQKEGAASKTVNVNVCVVDPVVLVAVTV